ncbi:hypothetical protein Q674_00375 [Acinetobacter sp. COS3]|uniref:hypothetical protein n=1 Tax=Acinetobacter sp. COS3 TaxID=1397525 RepID=UPI0003B7FB25|nr:hypothetical protein [Acinetobacter sp. COS3]ERS04269.1 hypothetical protein Q674_00375 [Acinetobacter sp. COS3]
MTGFVAGTLVHTEKGLVPIQEINVGDRVLSRSENNEEETVYKSVLNISSSFDSIIFQLCYYNIKNPMSDLQAQILYLAGGNLIWVVKDEDGNIIDKWLPVENIIGGSQVVLNNGDLAEVDGIQEVLRTNNKNVGDIFDILNDRPEILVDFSHDKLEYYYIEHLFRTNESYRYEYHSHIEHNFSDKISIMVGNYNIKVVKEYFDFFEVRTCPQPYTRSVYNLEVEDHHTYFVGYDGIWVHC